MGFNSALAHLSETDFQFLLKNGSRRSVLNDYDFESLTLCRWKFLKERLPELIKIGNFEKLILEMFLDRDVYLFPTDIERLDVNDVMQFVLWVTDEMAAISKMELLHLSSEPDSDLTAAGINEMNVFGDLNSIDQLAGGDVLKWEQVKRLRYHQVFDKQYKAIIEARIEKRLIKIKNKPKGKQ